MEQAQLPEDFGFIATRSGPIGQHQGPEGLATRTTHPRHQDLISGIACSLKARMGKDRDRGCRKVLAASAATHLAARADLAIGQETSARQAMEDVGQLEPVGFFVHGARTYSRAA